MLVLRTTHGLWSSSTRLLIRRCPRLFHRSQCPPVSCSSHGCGSGCSGTRRSSCARRRAFRGYSTRSQRCRSYPQRQRGSPAVEPGSYAGFPQHTTCLLRATSPTDDPRCQPAHSVSAVQDVTRAKRVATAGSRSWCVPAESDGLSSVGFPQLARWMRPGGAAALVRGQRLRLRLRVTDAHGVEPVRVK